MIDENESELQLSYRNTVVVALNYLAVGLKSFVEQQLQRQFKDTWQDNISSVPNHKPALTDSSVLLKTIYDHWNRAFHKKLQVPHSVVRELKEYRNVATHGEFTAESFNNSISSMLRLLRSVPQSAEVNKAIERIEKLKNQPIHQSDETASISESGTTGVEGIEREQDASGMPLAAIPVVPDTVVDVEQYGKSMPAQTEQEIELSQPELASPLVESPSVTYQYNRLCFKAKYIEPLDADQVFRVVTPVGSFQMTKGEFYRVFPRVIVSKSYAESGIYHYPSVPKSALPYRLPD